MKTKSWKDGFNLGGFNLDEQTTAQYVQLERRVQIRCAGCASVTHLSELLLHM